MRGCATQPASNASGPSDRPRASAAGRSDGLGVGQRGGCCDQSRALAAAQLPRTRVCEVETASDADSPRAAACIPKAATTAVQSQRPCARMVGAADGQVQLGEATVENPT